MTAFNTAEYVGEAIESILQQETSRVWQLLFVDDGSTDATLAIAEQYAERLPDRVQVFVHEGNANRGISASRNLALQHARGRVVAFLDSDDVWLPHHLETMTTLLDSMPHVAMVYAEAERWVDVDRPFDETWARAATWGSNYLPPLVPPGETSGLLPPGKLINWFVENESFVPCICTVLVRTEIARNLHGFCDTFRGLYDDQVFHAKVSRRYWVYALNSCVARYRQRDSSCCARARNDPSIERELRQMFKRFLVRDSCAS